MKAASDMLAIWCEDRTGRNARGRRIDLLRDQNFQIVKVLKIGHFGRFSTFLDGEISPSNSKPQRPGWGILSEIAW
jgi:hypothetical protein